MFESGLLYSVVSRVFSGDKWKQQLNGFLNSYPVRLVEMWAERRDISGRYFV